MNLFSLKKTYKTFLISVFFLIFFTLGAEDKKDISRLIYIDYFYQPGCAECAMINSSILPRLEERYKGLYELKKCDTGIKDNFLKLVEYQDRLNITENEPVYMIINSKYALAGYKKIFLSVFDIMDTCVNESMNTSAPARPSQASLGDNHKPPDELLHKKASGFTLLTVIIAGLIDGINPCVFSTLVFFISLLSVSGIRGKRLILTGTVYCIACFITYLALGFGILRFLKLFSGYLFFQNALNLLMILILFAFAFFSFRDAWRYYKTGAASSVLIKLPSSIQARIHKLMRGGLSYKYLIPGAFFIGFSVTVLESVCTGQVYVPTLVLMTQSSGMLSKWFMYLLLYNLMFIIPLVIVFIAGYCGMTAFRLINFSKRNVLISKVLLGLFFIFMALLLCFI